LVLVISVSIDFILDLMDAISAIMVDSLIDEFDM